MMGVWKTYYRIEGDTKQAVEAVEKQGREAAKEQIRIAKDLGADGYFVNSRSGSISSLGFKGEIPNWCKPYSGGANGLKPATPRLNSKQGKAARKAIFDAPKSGGMDALLDAAGLSDVMLIDGHMMHGATCSHLDFPSPAVLASVPRREGDGWTVPADFTEILSSEYHAAFEAHNAAVRRVTSDAA